MKLFGKPRQDAESTAKKAEAKEALPKAGIPLDVEELSAASGGCGIVNRIIGDPECDCSGEYVQMIITGTDPTGRITFYQCPLCGKSESVYG